MSTSEFAPGYRRLKKRLRSALRDRTDLDRRLRRAWLASLTECNRWTRQLDLRPRRRGIHPSVARLLERDISRDPVITAPVVIAVLSADPGSEPDGLLGRLVEAPPRRLRAIRIMALEAIGFTNRSSYIPLLEQVAAEPKPFSGLALRALGRMDGGARAIERVLAGLADGQPVERSIARALITSPDVDDVDAIVARWFRGGVPGGEAIAHRVAMELGGFSEGQDPIDPNGATGEMEPLTRR